MAKAKRAHAIVQVLVTVDERHRGHLDDVARQLESAGMSVAERFTLGGVIAGEVAANDLGKLRSVDGIETVEEDCVTRAF